MPIKMSNMTQENQIPVGTFPYDVAITPDGKSAFVTRAAPFVALVQVDIATQEVTKEITDFPSNVTSLTSLAITPMVGWLTVDAIPITALFRLFKDLKACPNPILFLCQDQFPVKSPLHLTAQLLM